jgi:hypothetical protein
MYESLQVTVLSPCIQEITAYRAAVANVSFRQGNSHGTTPIETSQK